MNRPLVIFVLFLSLPFAAMAEHTRAKIAEEGRPSAPALQKPNEKVVQLRKVETNLLASSFPKEIAYLSACAASLGIAPDWLGGYTIGDDPAFYRLGSPLPARSGKKVGLVFFDKPPHEAIPTQLLFAELPQTKSERPGVWEDPGSSWEPGNKGKAASLIDVKFPGDANNPELRERRESALVNYRTTLAYQDLDIDVLNHGDSPHMIEVTASTMVWNESLKEIFINRILMALKQSAQEFAPDKLHDGRMANIHLEENRKGRTTSYHTSSREYLASTLENAEITADFCRKTKLPSVDKALDTLVQSASAWKKRMEAK